jgi:hypothetical protein
MASQYDVFFPGPFFYVVVLIRLVHMHARSSHALNGSSHVRASPKKLTSSSPPCNKIKVYDSLVSIKLIKD